MKIVVKDKDGKIVYSSDNDYFVDVELGDYDVAKVKTHNGSRVSNDMKKISMFRIQTATDS